MLCCAGELLKEAKHFLEDLGRKCFEGPKRVRNPEPQKTLDMGVGSTNSKP